MRSGADASRTALRERHGFARVERRLRRKRGSRETPHPNPDPPDGDRVRPLAGEAEPPTFLALSPDSSGAGPTLERRRERLRRAGHTPELVIEAPGGALVAFCHVEAGGSSQMPLAPRAGCLAQLGAARSVPYEEFARVALRAGMRELRARGMAANEREHARFAAEGCALIEGIPCLSHTGRGGPSS